MAGDPALLDRALELFTQAVDTIPRDQPERANWLTNIAIVHVLRYRHTADRADIDQAVELSRQLSRRPAGTAPEPDSGPGHVVRWRCAALGGAG